MERTLLDNKSAAIKLASQLLQPAILKAQSQPPLKDWTPFRRLYCTAAYHLLHCVSIYGKATTQFSFHESKHTAEELFPRLQTSSLDIAIDFDTYPESWKKAILLNGAHLRIMSALEKGINLLLVESFSTLPLMAEANIFYWPILTRANILFSKLNSRGFNLTEFSSLVNVKQSREEATSSIDFCESVALKLRRNHRATNLYDAYSGFEKLRPNIGGAECILAVIQLGNDFKHRSRQDDDGRPKRAPRKDRLFAIELCIAIRAFLSITHIYVEFVECLEKLKKVTAR